MGKENPRIGRLCCGGISACEALPWQSDTNSSATTGRTLEGEVDSITIVERVRIQMKSEQG